MPEKRDPFVETWTIEWVLIDAAGNADDFELATRCVPDGSVQSPVETRLGGVDYTFFISKSEITYGQWAAFLNHVAWESDPNALFSRFVELSERGA